MINFEKIVVLVLVVLLGAGWFYLFFDLNKVKTQVNFATRLTTAETNIQAVVNFLNNQNRQQIAPQAPPVIIPAPTKK